MRLEVVTPRGTMLSTEVDEVTAPGILGEFGVLPGHIPFFTGIRPGVLHYRGVEGGALAVGPGYAEISNDRIVVLCDAGARVEDIDLAAAQHEAAEARRKLDHWDSPDAGARADVESQLAWAQARVDAATAPTTHTSH